MSLINDALKKAQHMHGRGTPGFPAPTTAVATSPVALTSTPTVAPTHHSAPASGGGMKFAAIGAGAVLLFGGIGYGVYASLSSSPAAPAIAQSQPAPVALAPATPPPPPAPVIAPTPAAAVVEAAPVAEPIRMAPPEVARNLPSPAFAPAPAIVPLVEPATDPIGFSLPSSAAESETAPEAEASSSATPAFVAAPTGNAGGMTIEINNEPPRGSNSPPPLAAESPTAKKPDVSIQAWVEAIRVIGVRSGVRPKVLMNDRVYAEGEIVNYDLNLKLQKINEQMLEFTDPHGNTYYCRF